MGRVKSCSTVLTNPWLVYRPGDSVTGTATLEIEGQLKVRKIRVVCRGQALAKWEKFLKNTFASDYESTEIYSNRYIDVYTAGPDVVMAAGLYKYNFTFKLPMDGIPSSFEGSLGAIRYWINVEVDQPFPSFNDRFYTPFTVLANIDLNEAIYRRPVSGSAQKPLSKALGIGSAGTLTASLSLDRSGYCPGEQIRLNLEAKNESTKDLGLVKASLVQIVNYKAADSTNSTTRTIRTVQSDKLGKGQCVKWTDQSMYVTLVPPSSKSLTCHIIQVSYVVRMEVEVPLGLDLELRIPITIGTVPLGVSLPPETERSASGISSELKYALCTAGYQHFTRTTIGFPFINYIPRTAIVKSSNQHLATNKHPGVAKLPPARNIPPVHNSSVAAAATPLPQIAETKYSKAAETEQEVPAVAGDPTLWAALPTYEEACANMIPTTPAPEYTPPETGSGCILILLFPCMDTTLVAAAFKENTSSLLHHRGRVVAFIPEVQLLPLQQTGAVLIHFDSDRIGRSWLQNMTDSDTELSKNWHALIGENKQPTEFTEDASMCKSISVRLFEKRADFKHSQSYWDEYNLLLNQALMPVKEKHKARTLVNGKAIFACGDWSSFPAKESELILVVTGYHDRESRVAFLEENNLEIRRFHELFLMYCSCLFKLDTETGDTVQFQNF